MEDLKKFEIEIFQLKPGIYHYDYVIEDTFFQLMGTSLTDKGNLRVRVDLEKNRDFYKLHFHIKGNVKLICDRSLEEFDQYLDVDKNLVLRYGEKTEEVSDDLETISHDTMTLNLAKYIYEYIGLEIPYKKLHPKFREQSTGDEQNPLVYQTETYEKKDIEDDIDPRWKALLKLKDN